MTAEVPLPKCLGEQAQEWSDFKICLVSDGNALLPTQRVCAPKDQAEGIHPVSLFLGDIASPSSFEQISDCFGQQEGAF